jgi:uncharacterized protein YecE (DUF72 family)
MKAGVIVKFTNSCKRKVCFSAVSASELPETLVKTAQIIYVRFHGKNGWYQHDYPDSELKDWSRKVKEQNAESILYYFNNDFNANAVKNCLLLEKFLETPFCQLLGLFVHLLLFHVDSCNGGVNVFFFNY